MLCSFIESRDVLKERIDTLFGSWDSLFPDVQCPKVYLGIPANEPPFYVAVDEVVDAATTEGGVTMAHDNLSWTLHVWAFSRHSSLEAASNTLLAYCYAIIGAVMADQTLCRTCDNCFAAIDSAGTAVDSSKYYQAAAVVSVQCTIFSVCPKEIRDIVIKTKE